MCRQSAYPLKQIAGQCCSRVNAKKNASSAPRITKNKKKKLSVRIV